MASLDDPSADTVLDGNTSPASEPGHRIVRGTAIGRFVVLGELGAGGMGVVYAAYDADLDRKVAIKLLRAGGARDARTRLLREAQAMAKINHANVLKVHEVGTIGEQIFLAMEFADGGTLRAWCESTRRPSAEIVDKLRQAGRGLAAAHALGLVHRDFKPDNVLLGKDGSVRVTDFGLVSALDAPAQPPVEAPDLESSGRRTPLSEQLTRTGAMMGTPAYMAPEQLAGTATPQSDQFAFCVTLFEALYGTRPFTGTNVLELNGQIASGEIAAPPKDRQVPARLRKVVLRGLAADPGARYPSMQALLAALADDPPPRRRRVALAIGVLALAGGGALAVATRSDETDPCTGDERAAAMWTPERRAALKAAFDASRQPSASTSFVRASLLVDGWLASWQLGVVGRCRVARAGDDRLADRGAQCLDRALASTRATIDAITTGGAAGDGAVLLLSDLPPVAPCADRNYLQFAIAPRTAAETAEIGKFEAMFAGVVAQMKLGHPDAALAMLGPALEAARAGGYGVEVAKLLRTKGWIRARKGDVAGEQDVREAIRAAAEADAYDEIVEGDLTLLDVLNLTQRRYDSAHEVADLADALARRPGIPAETRVAVDVSYAEMAAAHGDLAIAHARFDRALATAEKIDPESTSMIQVCKSYGHALRVEGRYADARKQFERAAEIVGRLAGIDTPTYASLLTELGIVARAAGQLDNARRLH